MTLRDQVREFHDAFGVPCPTRPAVPDEARVRLRLRLIAEEFQELLDACLGEPTSYDHAAWKTWNQLDALDALIERAPIRVDLVGAVDALADLQYVIEGSFLELGVDSGPVLDEVHRSNMAKVGGPIDARGKVQKPAGWTPPDLEGELVRQGWRK